MNSMGEYKPRNVNEEDWGEWEPKAPAPKPEETFAQLLDQLFGPREGQAQPKGQPLKQDAAEAKPPMTPEAFAQGWIFNHYS
jgi:hypothetical protein